MDPNEKDAVPVEGGNEEANPVDVQAEALAAFDEGVSLADEAPAPPAPAGDDDGANGDEGGSGDGAGAGGEPEAAGDDGANGKPAAAGEETDEERAARELAERESAAKAEDDTAVKELGLRGKAEQRFRDLSGQVRELSQKLEQVGGEEVLELVTGLGGKAGLERVVQDAQAQHEWDRSMATIGCTPEQFGQAMGFLKAVNSDDPVVLKQARDNLLAEIAHLDGRLGEKTERHNPLDAHADLKAKVQRGDLDEEDALEIARLRAGGQKAQQQTEQQRQQAEAAQAQEQGTASLRQLGAALKQRDGESVFTAKMAMITQALNAALPDLPPAQWAKHAQVLYDSIPAPRPAAAAPAPRVGKGPVRQSNATVGSAGGAHPNVPKDPWSAFDQGVAEAREVGL